MLITGKLYAQSPIYRGNSRKTLFTRDDGGKERLVSLSGKIEGTAQSLMDAFIGHSKNQKNSGLLNQLWQRLYDEPMPDNFINDVSCKLSPECYNKSKFFDLRMGLRLDEHRGAAQSGSNYKIETIFRNAEFDFKMSINQSLLSKDGNAAKFLAMLEELQAGRFWFGAGKSKGLGRCRLKMLQQLPPVPHYPDFSRHANHLSFDLTFDTVEPVLVGWNWGKADPTLPAFAAIEGKFLIDAFRQIPQEVRSRLMTAFGGPINDVSEWLLDVKKSLPRTILLWLMTPDQVEKKWFLPEQAIKKMTKGKFGLSSKIVKLITPIIEKDFLDKTSLESEFIDLLGEKDGKKYRRILDVALTRQAASESIDINKLSQLKDMGISEIKMDEIISKSQDENAMMDILSTAFSTIDQDIAFQVEQQIKLIQSDPWVDTEIESRKSHLRIKEMLISGQITDKEWGDIRAVPNGVLAKDWRDFIQSHTRVPYHQMVNIKNLQKSIVNDQNIIDFLEHHRHRTHQELAKQENIDFRMGGANGSVSQASGKPYDSIFMRMLSWSKANNEDRWEVYIPGATIKGAFRRRATQILLALWGDIPDVDECITMLFGAERKPGLLKFSDAYPVDGGFSRKVWCSMDSVSINPQTGRPLDKAKSDYLFAYGDDLEFSLNIVAQDIGEHDIGLISILSCLINDFQSGDIPLGSDKTSGLGWVKAKCQAINWLAGKGSSMTSTLFSGDITEKDGGWNRNTLTGGSLQKWLENFSKISVKDDRSQQILPVLKTNDGYVSHKGFGGYCGHLSIEGEVLTPLHVSESGEPSCVKIIDNKHCNGWDMFSLSSPESKLREQDKQYAIPSKTLKGLIRAIYSISSDSRNTARNIKELNAAERLFGWVGDGHNQALMGRLSFDFARFQEPDTQWGCAPHDYGNWHLSGSGWEFNASSRMESQLLANFWRIFPHANPAPCIKWFDVFEAEDTNCSYFNAIQKGSKCHFGIRFWNLNKEELERLIWCIVLENGMAHKVGKFKQIGLGSIKFSLQEDSYLINWSKRYSNSDGWRQKINVDEWLNSKVIKYHDGLREFLNVAPI